MAKPDPCSKCNLRHPSNVECQLNIPAGFTERAQEGDYCKRCGLTHNAVDQEWHCIDCGAVLCSNQIRWLDDMEREVDEQKFYHKVWVFGKKPSLPGSSWCGPCRYTKGSGDPLPAVDLVMTETKIHPNPRKLKSKWTVEEW